jgi:hypothetical protein
MSTTSELREAARYSSNQVDWKTNTRIVRSSERSSDYGPGPVLSQELLGERSLLPEAG